MSILVEHLTHIYNPRTPSAKVALRDVSLRIEDGTCAAIIGVTGSGKSTLVQHFNGLLKPMEGRVVVDGVDVGARETRGAVLRDLRRRVGLLFQFPEAQLFAPTVYDDIAFGMRQIGLDPATIDRRVRDALAAVALEPEPSLLFRSPFALSGGQRRRVALAGVLAQRPRVLVLDEPSAGLDAEARDELYAQLARLGSRRSVACSDAEVGQRERAGMTIVLVSHDMSEVAALADIMFVLANGELRLAGTPDEVFQHTNAIADAGLLPPPLAQVVALAGEHGLNLHPERLTLDGVADAIVGRDGDRGLERPAQVNDGLKLEDAATRDEAALAASECSGHLWPGAPEPRAPEPRAPDHGGDADAE